jgi:thiol-disulfide isomerase/thioredoxin
MSRRPNIGYCALLASCILLFSSPVFASKLKEFNPPESFNSLDYKNEKGEIHNTSQSKAKLTLVHFWATWCAPCVKEFPQIDTLQHNYADKGLRIIALSIEGERGFEKIQRFFTSNGITHITPYIAGSTVIKDTGIRGLPTTFFIDRHGKKIALLEGPIDWSSTEIITYIEKNIK